MMHISIILDPSPWCMYVWCTDVWCTMHKSMILFHDPDDAWIWGGVCIYDAVLFGDQRTDERTDEQGDSRSRIHDPDTCVYDAHIYDPRSLTLMHVCMMHISMILDLHPEACMYVWCMYLWCGKFCSGPTNEQGDSRSRMHVCIMHIHMLLDHYAYVHDALMYDAYIHDPWYLTMLHVCMMRLKFCHQRTNGRTNKAILGVGYMILIHACMMHL